MRHDRLIAPLAGLGLILLFAACPPSRRPPAVTGLPDSSRSTTASDQTTSTASATDTGSDIQGISSDDPSASDFSNFDQSGVGGPLEDIRFDYDSHSLSDEARAILAKNAEWLKQNPRARVMVEGHCDERGTVDYNLALGEQRALAARDYLQSLGVAAERMRTASYGKERPVDTGQNETAWAKNRRAHFSVSK